MTESQINLCFKVSEEGLQDKEIEFLMELLLSGLEQDVISELVAAECIKRAEVQPQAQLTEDELKMTLLHSLITDEEEF